jgi:hypothetical protein
MASAFPTRAVAVKAAARDRARLRFAGAVSSSALRLFGVVVSIRAAYWFVAAVALLWVPLAPQLAPPFRAYDARTDLLFRTFAQWDSQWFLHVVRHGYDSVQSAIFFPVYPLVVRGLAIGVRSDLVAAVLVSLVAAGIGLVLVERIGQPLLGARQARDGAILLALFPMAFVFTAPQSDGLFLGLVAAAFFCAQKQRIVTAGVLAGLAVGTRLLGLALLPALVILLWPRERTLRGFVRLWPLLAIPGSLLGYSFYLHRHFGDWFAYQHAQHTYWQRDTPTLGPLGGLFDALSAGWRGAGELVLHLPRTDTSTGLPQRDQWATWNLVHALLLLAAIALTWVAWKRLGPAFAAYSAGMLVLVLAAPPDYQPLADFPRYLLGDFPVFLALASFLDGMPRARQVLLYCFAAGGALAAVGFSRKVWVS